MRRVPKLVLATLIAMTGLWAGTTRIQAADDAAVGTSLATAPAGLNQLDKLFTLPTTFQSGVANSAKIADVTNVNSPNTQAVQVIGGNKQVGGFWSSDNNLFDLNQDTTLKTWVFLGASSKKPGDGMAFVLQNDPNGTSAAASLSAGNIIGETLGVWGVDTNNKEKEPQAIASTAIQNSWALEMDTYANNSTGYSDAGKGDSFDRGIKVAHMATGYPGAAKEYTSKSVNGLDITGIVQPTRYYFYQPHATNLASNVSLNDGQWHHLVFNWHAASKTMTYTYDDLNPDGTEKAGTTNSEVIDTSQFNSSNGLVRWGFVGATGSNTSTNMVVIETLPNLLQAKAAVQVTDKTKDKVVTAGAKVKAKHKLQYDYTLTYEDGRQDWDNIQADLKLPENVTFDEAHVTYADGSTQTLTAPTGNSKEVSYKLEKALSKDQPTATVTLTGKADDVKTNAETTTTTSTFKNRNFETTADAPDYTITVDQQLQITFLKSKYEVDKGKDVLTQGIVIAEDSNQLTNSDITIHPTLNGEELPAFQMKDSDESALFNLTIKSDQLNVGKNVLTAWASDMDDNETEVMASTVINVKGGELGFKTVSKESAFKPITLDGQAQTTGRQDNWELVVSDERGADTNDGWQLQASVSDFKTVDGKRLPGEVIFKQGNQTTVLGSQGTVIDSHKATSDTDEYDVVKNWSNDSGIMYKTNAAATPGAYSGQITWTLNNAPS